MKNCSSNLVLLNTSSNKIYHFNKINYGKCVCLNFEPKLLTLVVYHSKKRRKDNIDYLFQIWNRRII